MAGRIERKRGIVQYSIEFDLSNDRLDITFEPETSDSFSTVSLTNVTVQVEEFNGLIESMIKIRDDIKNMIANDAGFAIGGQRTAPAK